MEAQELLWLGVATIVFVDVFLRRSTRHAPFSPIHPTVQISSAAIAQRMLFEDADAFSDRPTTPFPLDFAAGQRADSIATMPYGPLWRMLRCSLTAGVLHPTRLSLHEPIQREAVKGLVAGLYAAHAAAAGEVMVVRDSIRTAVYALMVRLCFGGGDDDGIHARDVHAIDRAQLEFLVAYAGAKDAEGSRLPRLVYWRRWLRFDAAFNRLSELLIPLIVAARRRRQAQRGCGGGGGFVPYVDSLLNLRVHDDDERVDDNAGRMLKDKEMASQPEVQNKLHREVVQIAGGGVVAEEHLRSSPYLRAVILECLRMHPTVPFLMREVVSAHVDVAAVGGRGGATKPSTVMINARDIGRDRNAWTDPDEFRPDRFLDGGEGEGVGPVPGPKQEIKMIPFGAGRRYCPGAGMGMLHIGCFLAALVREFEWAPPAAHQGGGGSVDMTEVDMFFKLMRTPLRARITPRSSA